MRAWAIVPAAGVGERFGASEPKAFLPVAGVPMLARSAAALSKLEGIVVAAPGGWEERALAIAAPAASPAAVRMVAGGGSRTQSVRCALAAVPDEADVVVVHDAARPLASAALVQRVLAGLERADAAIAAVPLADTLKRAARGAVEGTIERDGLWRAQTPQAFVAAVLREAHERAAADGFEGTDDASLVERLGTAVVIVEGEECNIKVTRPEDLVFAEAILRAR